MFQSRPARQRRALVIGWWNLWFVLTLHERASCTTPLHGLIHLTTTPFRLSVSSGHAPEIPSGSTTDEKISCHESNRGSNQFCNDRESCFWFKNMVQEIGYHGLQFLKYFMLCLCPTERETNAQGMDRLTKKNILRSEWLLQNLTTIQFLQLMKAICN